MKYGIYQITITADDSREINSMANPYKNHPKFAAHRIVSGARTVEDFEAGKGFYKKVAEIEANDLEHVFEISNLGHEKFITRLARMHSLSVGDIVVDGNDIQWGVADVGFDEVSEIV
jgi:hypothetical protein